MKTCPSFAFVWERDADAVCAAVRQTRSTLKILLKTRNEDYFIAKWLDHYLGILAPEDKIIVLDNMSTNDAVFSAYERYRDRIILVRYEGHSDSAHSLKRFADLYRAVWDTSLFYALFDTDEFLVLYDGRKIIRDGRILRYLQSHADAALFPTVFLNNVFSRDDAFLFEESGLEEYHLGGKPVLNAALMREKLRPSVGHNSNVPVFLLNRRTPVSFILCHMTRLSREQRVLSTMQKLVNYGLLTDETDMSFLDSVRDDDIPDSLVRGYVIELRWLLGIRDEREAMRDDMRRDHFVIAPDGTLAFSSARAKAAFAEHVSDKKNMFDVLGLNARRFPDPALPLAKALETLGNGR